jgi:hypothetical protein
MSWPLLRLLLRVFSQQPLMSLAIARNSFGNDSNPQKPDVQVCTTQTPKREEPSSQHAMVQTSETVALVVGYFED